MKSLLCLAALCAAVAPAAVCPGQSFIPGRIYTSWLGGFQEWDQSLNMTRQVSITGFGGASGCVFNSAGNLVMVAYYLGGPKLLEINASGQVLRSVVLNTGGSLLYGSDLAYNAATGQYVVAEERRLRLLDSGFNTVAVTADVFQRASGVAFGPDGRVYGSDQFAPGLRTFTPLLAAAGNVPIPFERTGMDLASNGDLLVTSFGEGRLDRLNTVTGVVTPILTSLGYGEIVEVEQLPDGRMVTVRPGEYLRMYSATGTLLTVATQGLSGGDGVAYYIPTPGAAALLTLAGVAAARRRRK